MHSGHIALRTEAPALFRPSQELLASVGACRRFVVEGRAGVQVPCAATQKTLHIYPERQDWQEGSNPGPGLESWRPFNKNGAHRCRPLSAGLVMSWMMEDGRRCGFGGPEEAQEAWAPCLLHIEALLRTGLYDDVVCAGVQVGGRTLFAVDVAIDGVPTPRDLAFEALQQVVDRVKGGAAPVLATSPTAKRRRSAQLHICMEQPSARAPPPHRKAGHGAARTPEAGRASIARPAEKETTMEACCTVVREAGPAAVRPAMAPPVGGPAPMAQPPPPNWVGGACAAAAVPGTAGAWPCQHSCCV